MQTKSMRRHLAIYAFSGALFTTSVQAGESSYDQIRAGFDALSREMSTCAAYFSPLSSIVENAEGLAAKAETARRIKSIGQTLLTQSINVAKLIDMADDTVMERVQAALKEMANFFCAPLGLLEFMRAHGCGPFASRPELLLLGEKREVVTSYTTDRHSNTFVAMPMKS